MSFEQLVVGSSGLTVTVSGIPVGYRAAIGAVQAVAPLSGVVTLTLAASPATDPLVILDGFGTQIEAYQPLETQRLISVSSEDSWGGAWDDAWGDSFGVQSLSTFATTGNIYGGDSFRFTTPLADWMYARVSGTMQFRDSQGGAPLADIVRLMGAGVQAAKDAAGHLVDLIDIETCPASYLPQFGALLGFEFPYDLEESLQRNFIRSAVALYRIKGTPSAMQLVVDRLIAGKGFSIDVINEDYLAKTFDVQLTADDTADGSGFLQDKVVYLVGVYSPAGMVPSVIVLFSTTETLDATRQAESYTSLELTRWSMTVAGHTFNTVAPGGTVAMNTLGQQVLAL
jgi:P2-related tail formation protein